MPWPSTRASSPARISTSWFRRFHDRYHNEAAILQTGVRQQPWADALSLEMAYSHEYTDIQNANLMKIVFGGKFRTAEVWSPSLRYEKRDLFAEGLSLRLSARCDFVHTQNVDTLSRTYNWAGDYREKDYQGEGVPTQADFRGRPLSAVSLLSWCIDAATGQAEPFMTFAETDLLKAVTIIKP